MNLKLDKITPFPLKEKIIESQIWNKNISFEPPEKIFIRAASGKGKSTLLHIIYGLRNDFEGRFSWNHQANNQIKESGWANLRSRQLSIVFQDLRLFPDLTVIENIEIKRSLNLNFPKDRIYKYLNQLGMNDKINQKAVTLSYGEKQRVAIIRSLAQPFCWLLLDEPFSHLDDRNIEIAAEIIEEEVNAQKAGIIMVDLEDNNRFHFNRKFQL